MTVLNLALLLATLIGAGNIFAIAFVKNPFVNMEINKFSLVAFSCIFTATIVIFRVKYATPYLGSLRVEFRKFVIVFIGLATLLFSMMFFHMHGFQNEHPGREAHGLR